MGYLVCGPPTITYHAVNTDRKPLKTKSNRWHTPLIIPLSDQGLWYFICADLIKYHKGYCVYVSTIRYERERWSFGAQVAKREKTRRREDFVRPSASRHWNGFEPRWTKINGQKPASSMWCPCHDKRTSKISYSKCILPGAWTRWTS